MGSFIKFTLTEGSKIPKLAGTAYVQMSSEEKIGGTMVFAVNFEAIEQLLDCEIVFWAASLNVPAAVEAEQGGLQG